MVDERGGEPLPGAVQGAVLDSLPTFPTGGSGRRGDGPRTAPARPVAAPQAGDMGSCRPAPRGPWRGSWAFRDGYAGGTSSAVRGSRPRPGPMRRPRLLPAPPPQGPSFLPTNSAEGPEFGAGSCHYLRSGRGTGVGIAGRLVDRPRRRISQGTQGRGEGVGTGGRDPGTLVPPRSVTPHASIPLPMPQLCGRPGKSKSPFNI